MEYEEKLLALWLLLNSYSFLKILQEVFNFFLFHIYTFNLDKSQFEGELLAFLCKQLEKADIDVQTKLLICTIANRFDDFDGHLEQVIDFKFYFLHKLDLIFIEI